MYERRETKTTTAPDGTSYHSLIEEKSGSGLREVFIVPVAICITSVACGLILQVGINISHSLQQRPQISGGVYTVIQGE